MILPVNAVTEKHSCKMCTNKRHCFGMRQNFNLLTSPRCRPSRESKYNITSETRRRVSHAEFADAFSKRYASRNLFSVARWYSFSTASFPSVKARKIVGRGVSRHRANINENFVRKTWRRWLKDRWLSQAWQRGDNNSRPIRVVPDAPDFIAREVEEGEGKSFSGNRPKIHNFRNGAMRRKCTRIILIIRARRSRI